MNKKTIYVALLGGALLSSCGQQKSTTYSTAPTQFKLSDELVMSTLWYQSESADLVYEQSYELALQKLRQNLERFNSNRPPAVILDIDETVLDNSPYEARLINQGKNFTPETWAQWVNEANADLLPGVKAFLTRASQLGVEIYYISNRSADLMEPTLANLEKFGLPQVDQFHVLLKEETSDKTERRNMVKRRNQVVLLIGDQPGDFAENFSEIYNSQMRDSLRQSFILLPNPMYGNFEGKIYPEENYEDVEKSLIRRKALDQK